ncbi:hypothetical protein [Streptomyces bluensis]|uniref:Uncharacterized protein n=1 Tax=Streptomyces bluensis TaxID=33897 RepID=A0ABW6UDU3_9ACTN
MLALSATCARIEAWSAENGLDRAERPGVRDLSGDAAVEAR